jgi:long-chain acyl-CoA synthetase
VDKFLSAIGIPVIEGYGMTETCAITTTRSEKMPSPGTIGSPVEGVFFKLIDDKGNDVAKLPGKKGVLWLKSVQNFQGYYKMEDVTRALFDANGYFNTGDIMMVNYRGELIFAGRAKDTIVLAGGENVEPGPIEEKLRESPLIAQCVVTGSERKHLSVLIVPEYDNVRAALPKIPQEPAPWNAMPEVRDLFKKEILRLISKENGFKAFEMIPGNAFTILPRPFDAEKEMTKTLKIKRNVVLETYQREIAAMYM